VIIYYDDPNDVDDLYADDLCGGLVGYVEANRLTIDSSAGDWRHHGDGVATLEV
jgi:hypothetical protein